MIGDLIERFYDSNLILLGHYLPYEWLCNKICYSVTEDFKSEGVVIQFLYEF